MTHLEGPVVDSFYEVALHSWYNKLVPMLPCVNQAYVPPAQGYRFSERNPYFGDVEVVKAAKAARKLLRRETAQAAEEDNGEAPPRLRDIVLRAMERAQIQAGESWEGLFPVKHPGANHPHATDDGDHGFITWADRVRNGFSASKPPSRRNSNEMRQKMGECGRKSTLYSERRDRFR